MNARMITECQACGHANLESVLFVGWSPITCDGKPIGHPAGPEERYPLELLQCGRCTLVQLSCIVDRNIVFPPDYTYSSGNNRALRENFADLAAQVGARPDSLVVDIGANDGTLLSNFPGCITVAVEPTDQILKTDASFRWQKPFTADVAREIVDGLGHAQVVTACNVLAHVDDVHDVLDGVRILLADDGVFVTENHDVSSVLAGQWDTVYHEHLRYYGSVSLSLLLAQHGLFYEQHQAIKSHGGSLRTFARRHGTSRSPARSPVTLGWAALRRNAQNIRAELRGEIVDRGPVGAIGATARATTILSYCGLTEDDITTVYEVASSDKIGRYMPGTRIPVVDEAELSGPGAPGTVVLFLWYIADKVVPKLRDLGYEGEIIVPLPEVRYERSHPTHASVSA